MRLRVSLNEVLSYCLLSNFAIVEDSSFSHLNDRHNLYTNFSINQNPQSNSIVIYSNAFSRAIGGPLIIACSHRCDSLA